MAEFDGFFKWLVGVYLKSRDETVYELYKSEYKPKDLPMGHPGIAEILKFFLKNSKENVTKSKDARTVIVLSSEDSSEEEKPAPQKGKPPTKAPVAKAADSDSSDDSSEEEKPAKKAPTPAKQVAKAKPVTPAVKKPKDSSDDSDDSSEEETSTKLPVARATVTKKAESSSDEEEEAPKKAVPAKPAVKAQPSYYGFCGYGVMESAPFKKPQAKSTPVQATKRKADSDEDEEDKPTPMKKGKFNQSQENGEEVTIKNVVLSME